MTLFYIGIALFVLSLIYRVLHRKGRRELLQPAPDGAGVRRLAPSAEDVFTGRTEAADVLPTLRASEYTDWEMSSASERPDGVYTAALVSQLDPDFPEIWVVVNATGEVVPLDCEALIDVPIHRIVWPQNDLSLIAFERYAGYARFVLDIEARSLQREMLDAQPTAVSEEWFVQLDAAGHAKWLRLRKLAGGKAQIYRLYPQVGPRSGDRAAYDYWLDAAWERSDLGNRHFPIWFDDAGRARVDASAVGSPTGPVSEEKALKIQWLLDDGKIVVPNGTSEEEIGARLRQPVL